MIGQVEYQSNIAYYEIIQKSKTYKSNSLKTWRGNMHNFRSSSKCSLLKLLCSLMHLCGRTPLQPLRLKFSGIDFPSHPRSQLPFITFRGQDNITRGKVCRSHERNPLPNLPTPDTYIPVPPNTYPPPS